MTGPRDARGPSRRAFIRDATAGSLALAGTAAVPSLLRAGEVLGAAGAEIAWAKAPCRLCGVGCGLLVGIENGRAVAVKGDPDSPVSRGLACVKGYHAVQALYGGDRITRALVRRGGALAPVPLSQALDLVARTLRDTIAQHGPDSVAMYGSAQWTATDAVAAERLFVQAIGSTRLDTSARLDAASGAAALTATFGLPGAPGCHEDVDHADVIVLWDANLAESDPVLFSRMLERRRANPAIRIVDLAARTTRTSYAADRSLLFNPGAEVAIANALCAEIVRRRWANRAFVDRHVAFKVEETVTARGARDERVAVRDATWREYTAFLERYTPAYAERVAGIPAEHLTWLASLYGDPARRVLTVWGASVNRRANGVWSDTALYALHLLTGKIASPGNGALFLPSHAGIEGAPRDAAAGTSALATFDALETGDVRFLWIQATNPMVSLPNLRRHRAAARQPDRFIVVSEVYPTATTDVADVVLPAATWIERDGVTFNSERRAQHFAALVPPPGDATPDGWQIAEVARRMGYAERFPADPATFVERLWEDQRATRRDPRDALPSVAELRGTSGILWPYVQARETRWRYNAAHDPAARAARGRGSHDFYGHEDRRAWIWLRAHDAAVETPDAAYPFSLETGPVLEHAGTGTLTRRIPTLFRAVPQGYAELNKDDAARLGIRDGDRVRLVSRRGAIEATARVERRSQPRPGSVFVPLFDETVPVNVLTSDTPCRQSGQPESGLCAVRVERVRRGGAA